MGGRSSSRSTQTSTSQQYSQANDGEFAGASDFVVDESDNSIAFDGEYAGASDFQVDNSTSEFNQDIDNSQAFDINQDINNSREIDNSLTNSGDFAGVSGRVSIDESQNDNSVDFDGEYAGASNFSLDESDNSITNDGDFAGASNITILDGGAIDDAFAFANNVDEKNRAFLSQGLDVVGESTQNALLANTQISSEVLDFAGGAIGETGLISRTAIEEISANSSENLAFSQDFANNALAGLGESFDAALGSISELSQSTSANSINGLNASLRVVSELSESIGTGGQSVVAESSENIVKYIALAAAAAAGAFLLRGAL